ncbi:ankyrin repeat domain-containing protein [Lederbergia sp. NSJ-179]|uniref:ankyrin repeat domain-containing protein n=1 Tax=Lederbergia sp. NSJ-179 TaxID=2931402 RepID=UPI001FD56A2D|nr:ankyrin repeat domain-containing protein [Lederbergia sp. NSJ-179]MCJ7842832.1 ankyrin repeat domain-containing protein [Lederbergia sp. NSJ-179]
MGTTVSDVFQLIESNDVPALETTLIANSSLANIENEQGITPLGFAAHLGKKQAVQLLLDFNADVNAVSHSKIDYIPSNTALHAAIAGARDLEIIELLLKNNANPDIVDSNGFTSLHTTAFHGNNQEIVRLLLEHGATIDTKMSDGKTAIDIAREQGNNQVAEQLQRYLELT